MSLSPELKKRIDDLVTTNRVVLFMKGTRRFPQCGFSQTVVRILDEMLPAYETVNVLADPELREGIKIYSEWPTIPQLYVEGKLIGGCDIVREMHASGELAEVLGAPKPAEAAPPTIAVTEAAARAFRDAVEGAGDEVLHLSIGADFASELYVGPREAGEIEVKAGGVAIWMDPATARRAPGLTIDYVSGPGGAGFKLENPNEPPRVKTMSVEELKGRLDRREALHLFDVRTEKERAIAVIPGARPLDDAAEEDIRALPKEAVLVFHCHHGIRSRAAAERYVELGYRNVFNLTGGIDAWSRAIDPSVPRY